MNKFKEVLEQIAYPVKHFQQLAKKEGNKIDGIAAIQLSNDAGYLKELARRGLESTDDIEPDKAKEIAYHAWKSAANAFRMYPNNKHTFTDYWSDLGENYVAELLNKAP